MPNLFVGGPLRGPPPPKGWNFFILPRSLAVCLALHADYVAWRAVRWQLARRTAARRETLMFRRYAIAASATARLLAAMLRRTAAVCCEH